MSKAKTVKQIIVPPINDEGHAWIPFNRDIVKGDIIRSQVTIPGHPMYGRCMYAIADGDGFGCRLSARGTAVYLYHMSFDIEEVIKFRDEHPEGEAIAKHFRMENYDFDGILVK